MLFPAPAFLSCRCNLWVHGLGLLSGQRGYCDSHTKGHTRPPRTWGPEPGGPLTTRPPHPLREMLEACSRGQLCSWTLRERAPWLSRRRQGDTPAAENMPEEGPHLDGLWPPRSPTPAPNANARSAVLMLVDADLIEMVSSAVSQIPTLIIARSTGKHRASWAQTHACSEDTTKRRGKGQIMNHQSAGSIFSIKVSDNPPSINLFFFTKY